MAVELAVAYVSIVPETSKLAQGVKRELGQVDLEAEKTGKRAGGKLAGGITGAMGGVASRAFAPLAAAAAGVGVAAVFGDMIKSASEFEQSVGGVGAVFKGEAHVIEDAAVRAASNLGLSKNAYQELATVLGASLKNKGIKDYTKQTQNLITIGSDLAAQYGGSTKEAVDALGAALRGESDPIERYGVSLNEAAIKAEAVRTGLAKTAVDHAKVSAAQLKAEVAQSKYNAAVKKYGVNSDQAKTAQAGLIGAQSALEKAMAGSNVELTDQQKAQAALSLISRQTADAQGAFAREADTLAGKHARLSASWENAKITLGGVFIPVVSAGLDVLSRMVGGVAGVASALKGMVDGTGDASGVLNGLRSAFDGVVNSRFGSWVRDMVTAIGAKLGPAFKAVSALVRDDLLPGLVVLGDGVKAAFRTFIDSPVVGFITSVLKPVILGFIDGVIDAVTGIVKVISGVVKVIGGILTGDWGRVWEGAKGVVGGALQAIWGLLQAGFAGRILGVFSVFGRAVTAVFKGVGSFLSGFFRGIITEVAAQAPKFGAAFKVVGDGFKIVGSVLSTVWSAIRSQVLEPLGTWFTSKLPGAAKVVHAAVTGAWTLIGSGVIGAVLNLTRGSFDKLVTLFTKTLPDAARFVRDSNVKAWQMLADLVGAAFGTLRMTVLDPVKAWFTQTVPAAAKVLKDAVSARWSEMVSAYGRVFGEFRTTVLDPVKTWFTSTLPTAARALKDQASARWSELVTAVGRFFGDLRRVVLDPVKAWFTQTLPGAARTLKDQAAARWSELVSAFGRVFGEFRRNVLDPVRTWFGTTLPGAARSMKDAVGKAFSGMGSAINSTWRDTVNPVFGTLKRSVEAVGGWFRGARDAIGRTWGGLASAISKPVNDAKNWINRNLSDKLNYTLDKIGVSFRIPALASGGVWAGPGQVVRAASGAVLPGYTPRRDVHMFTSPTGGRLALSGGEAVMVPEWTRAVGPAAVHMMNRMARRGGAKAIREMFNVPMARHAAGGIIGGRSSTTAPGGARLASGGILDKIKDTASAITAALTDPAGAIRTYGLQLLSKFPGGNAIAEIVKGFGGKLVGGVIEKVKDMVSNLVGGFFKRGGKWPPAVMGRVSANTAAAVAYGRATWGLRNIGTLGQRANKSDHPRGKAADFMIPNWTAGSGIGLGNRVASFFVSNPGRFGTKYVIWREKINSGSGWRHYTHPLKRRDKTSLHYDHVHVSFLNRGGIVGSKQAPLGAKIYDQGGMLRKGDLAYHAASRPDRVLTERQWTAVERHLPTSAPLIPTPGQRTGGDVIFNGPVWQENPDALARAIERRRADQMALLTVQGVA